MSEDEIKTKKTVPQRLEQLALAGGKARSAAEELPTLASDLQTAAEGVTGTAGAAVAEVVTALETLLKRMQTPGVEAGGAVVGAAAFGIMGHSTQTAEDAAGADAVTDPGAPVLPVTPPAGAGAEPGAPIFAGPYGG